MSTTKLKYPVTLSPESVEVLRRLIIGETADRSPSIREVQRAIDDCGCTEHDRIDLLVVLGLEEEGAHVHGPPIAHPVRRKTD